MIIYVETVKVKCEVKYLFNMLLLKDKIIIYYFVVIWPSSVSAYPVTEPNTWFDYDSGSDSDSMLHAYIKLQISQLCPFMNYAHMYIFKIQTYWW